MSTFNELDTVVFNTKLKPYAHDTILGLFRPKYGEMAIQPSLPFLDKECGIDITLQCKTTGASFTVQEKYRKHSALQYNDFTQEYMNGDQDGKPQQGEWFHLYANYYFYGWSNPTEDGFEKWFLMDIQHYKFIVMQNRGLDKIGKLNKNEKHGKATFYSIPLSFLEPAMIAKSWK
jgi:hypothetical protein